LTNNVVAGDTISIITRLAAAFSAAALPNSVAFGGLDAGLQASGWSPD
jgi:hypothetical protein